MRAILSPRVGIPLLMLLATLALLTPGIGRIPLGFIQQGGPPLFFGLALLIVLGLINITKEFVPAFPIRLGIPHAAHQKIAVLMEKASVPTAVVLGGLVGLCEFPCTGGPYLLVLGLLHDHATYFTGVGYLIMYNLIFILPLVLILLIASDQALLAKVQAWQQGERKAMRWGGGVAMVALGAVIFAV